ncbi:MAG: SH3 domain-containing C40 family peptidase, partial [candidate division Zixibacteria bacterium]|nr:SH3 domain-containing C40 family peptidase [candidate division Zixibacteria bacterium]
MKYAFVRTNLLDLWSQPVFNSERLSQVLWGEPLIIDDEKFGFCRVRQPDGYSGWVDCRFLIPVNKSGYQRLLSKTNAVISTPTARVYTGIGSALMSPFMLFYGTKLIAKDEGEGFVKAILPDKNCVFVKRSNTSPINKRTASVANSRILTEAKKFLGTPYLWGGITGNGFDCSGFVKTVFSVCGVYLPRDTREQILVGEKVDQNRIRSGDLLFFRRHVGLAIGRSMVIHASQGG